MNPDDRWVERRSQSSPRAEPDEWREERARAVILAGFLTGLSTTDRFAFHDQERANLRAAAGVIARSIHRPDLVPDEPAAKGGGS